MGADGEPLEAEGLADLLQQLEDEAYAEAVEDGWLIRWDAIYALLSHPDYAPALTFLRLPPTSDAAPCLSSRGTLADEDFAISIAGWVQENGERSPVIRTMGAILETANGAKLMSAAAWALKTKIIAFANRPSLEKNDLAHRRQWGVIRQAALAAYARLDDFLFRTVVLTPQRLRVELRRADAGDTKVVEVIPGFDGCPDQWLTQFDRIKSVGDRYDLPTAEGIIQVLITPQVKAVLSEIKRMPGRRVVGPRGEAFVSNPFASLGDDASSVIDAEQFEDARARAGLVFERLIAHVRRDSWGYPIEVGLSVEGCRDLDDDELARFIDQAERKLQGGYQICAWRDYEFELTGDAREQLDILLHALDERRQPRILVRYAQIYDLSAYSARVEDIGDEKPYYSPYIAKKSSDEGWFPENLIPVISWRPDGESEPVAIPVTDALKTDLERHLDAAKARGETGFEVPGFPRAIPVAEAERIVSAFANSLADAKAGRLDPASPPRASARPKPGLVLKANIQALDYEEVRRDILRNAGRDAPKLPMALRDDVALKDHQLIGVAWLQYLFQESPQHCRGAVLADDMGLGKTLQILTFIAAAMEQAPSLDPVLVIAPVSLLENWQEEIDRFFRPGSLRVTMAYGDGLSALRAPRSAIDRQLQQEGLVNFLVPGWRGESTIVLTTYETLRDLEFSFAREPWSIMVCDEAQKVKTPAAMMTRAAKKQNVRFKIACTGTPVENSLADLWCLFDLVQPGMLGALNDFGRRYRRPIEAETDEEKARVEELRIKIQPQLLRRTKADVAKDLPNKIVADDCHALPLSDDQRNLYSQAVNLFRRRNDRGVAVPFKNHLGLLHYLRLVCTDPRRYGLDAFKPEPLEEYRRKAPKLDWLLRKLSEIREKQEKAIIFCEFRGIQRLLRYYIELTLGTSPDIINGDTNSAHTNQDSRQKRIHAFQQKSGFGVIILSPLAVGFGVNIQGANHVVHYTRTWNPAKEDQATDRAHRIGQTKPVYVYCPVVAAPDFTTFDVKLDELLERKRSLAHDMLNGSADVRPADFGLDEVTPEGVAMQDNAPIGLDDLLRMKPTYFEALIATLWQKRGFATVHLTPEKGDDGVDVVAFKNNDEGDLVQCKTSATEGARLAWDAIKDVVTGASAYRQRYPGVNFYKACATNQFFNENSRRQAEINNVTLYDQDSIVSLLGSYPVSLHDIEGLLFANWDGVTQ